MTDEQPSNALFVTEEQMQRVAAAAAQRVARIHRRRLTLATFFVTLFLSSIVAVLVGLAVADSERATAIAEAAANKRESHATCLVLTHLSQTMNDFVLSDAALRSKNVSGLQSSQLLSQYDTLSHSSLLKTIFKQQAATSAKYAAYWHKLVPLLTEYAQEGCSRTTLPKFAPLPPLPSGS